MMEMLGWQGAEQGLEGLLEVDARLEEEFAVVSDGSNSWIRSFFLVLDANYRRRKKKIRTAITASKVDTITKTEI